MKIFMKIASDKRQSKTTMVSVKAESSMKRRLIQRQH